MTSMRDLLIREEVLKYLGHSRLANTKFRGNGMMIGGQRKDIFRIRGDGMINCRVLRILALVI